MLALLLMIGVTACGSQAKKDANPNPLIVADEYVRTHYPKNALPQGLGRAWHVEDHGQIWTVEVFAQGAVGGGVKMAINKRDGRVLGSEPTQ